MMKYQFCIRFNNIDANSSASKAVLDCNKIFSAHGYQDYTITVGDNSKKLAYYVLLIKELFLFFISVKKGSLIGIQYPLLSINNVFKYFVKVLKIRGVRFFCVIHDLESLRTGGKDSNLIKREIDNLNCYDSLIVHNDQMLGWLKQNGVFKHMIPLFLFDYLSEDFLVNSDNEAHQGIAYAGNLSKSTFVYALGEIKDQKFNLYGPNFQPERAATTQNVNWIGEYNPDVIPKKLSGSFGLIWDGNDIDKCDDILGNYLKYNNPHKCSLYLVAGFPLIAPVGSAIGDFIRNMNIGLLVDSLYDLDSLQTDDLTYLQMKENVLKLRRRIMHGDFFTEALQQIESYDGI